TFGKSLKNLSTIPILKAMFSLFKQNKRRWTVLFFLALVSVSFSTICIKNIQNQASTKYPLSVNKTLDEGVYIFNNEDWGKYAFPGNGSEANPYLLTNLTFSTVLTNIIWIANTNRSFIIQNCIFFQGRLFISDVNAEKVLILGNLFFRAQEYFISVSNSKGVIISENTFSGQLRTEYFGKGVIINECPSTIVEGNSFNLPYSDGLSISSSPFTTIINNTFKNCGIEIVEKKRIYYSCCESVVTYNVENYGTYIIANNTINSLPLLYILNSRDLSLTNIDLGQLFIINCSNVLISNVSFPEMNSGMKIVSSQDIKINNIKFINCTKGLLIAETDHVEVKNCQFRNISFYGIKLDVSSHSIFFNNELAMCKSGIILSNSSFNEFTFNLFWKNRELYGMFVGSFSFNNIIHHNAFYYNNIHGNSQGFDIGSNTKWFDSNLKEGNYWHDLKKDSKYYLACSLEQEMKICIQNYDPYPLKTSPIELPEYFLLEETGGKFYVIILSLIFVAFPIIVKKSLEKKIGKVKF
ncbi:MAG: right-handed parallel beta-helix repeat-containing protein, partial [Candidatus Heimdallarchaeaceae archaeon]